MSREIKLAAKALGVPIILLSQLSRKHLDEKRKPELRDLRESGSIENDADAVLMIWRANLKQTNAQLLIRKQRQGPLGEIDLAFDGSVQRFTETGYSPAALESGLTGRGDTSYNGSTVPEFDEGDGPIDY